MTAVREPPLFWHSAVSLTDIFASHLLVGPFPNAGVRGGAGGYAALVRARGAARRAVRREGRCIQVRLFWFRFRKRRKRGSNLSQLLCLRAGGDGVCFHLPRLATHEPRASSTDARHAFVTMPACRPAAAIRICIQLWSDAFRICCEREAVQRAAPLSSAGKHLQWQPSPDDASSDAESDIRNGICMLEPQCRSASQLCFTADQSGNDPAERAWLGAGRREAPSPLTLSRGVPCATLGVSAAPLFPSLDVRAANVDERERGAGFSLKDRLHQRRGAIRLGRIDARAQVVDERERSARVAPLAAWTQCRGASTSASPSARSLALFPPPPCSLRCACGKPRRRGAQGGADKPPSSPRSPKEKANKG
jgi:hypothetical protein